MISEAALQIIETFHEKELLDKVVQIKQVDSDPTIPKKKVAASSENGQKRTKMVNGQKWRRNGHDPLSGQKWSYSAKKILRSKMVIFGQK